MAERRVPLDSDSDSESRKKATSDGEVVGDVEGVDLGDDKEGGVFPLLEEGLELDVEVLDAKAASMAARSGMICMRTMATCRMTTLWWGPR